MFNHFKLVETKYMETFHKQQIYSSSFTKFSLSLKGESRKVLRNSLVTGNVSDI